MLDWCSSITFVAPMPLSVSELITLLQVTVAVLLRVMPSPGDACAAPLPKMLFATPAASLPEDRRLGAVAGAALLPGPLSSSSMICTDWLPSSSSLMSLTSLRPSLFAAADDAVAPRLPLWGPTGAEEAALAGVGAGPVADDEGGTGLNKGRTN